MNKRELKRQIKLRLEVIKHAKEVTGNISGNVEVFQTLVFSELSGNPQFTEFISDYFPVFQNHYTRLYMKFYMGFLDWLRTSLGR